MTLPRTVLLGLGVSLAAPLLSQSTPDLQTAPRFVERPGVQEFTGRMIVRPVQVQDWVHLGVDPAEAALRHERAVNRLLGRRFELVEGTDEHLVALSGEDENAYAARLMATGDYEYVEPDWYCYPILIPNDPQYGQQWHHTTMGSPAGWDTQTGSSSYIAAFVDTGVDTDHDDLEAALVPGYNSVSGLTQGQGGDVEDVNGHGTNVAGCIGAIGNNGVGVTGVCWDVSLMPIRTTNDPGGGAYMSDLTEGARWAADNGAGSVSVSYSGVESSSVNSAGDYCDQRDCIVIWAAGNAGSTLSSSTDWANVEIVSATTQSDVIVSWSNRGVPIDVAAPGVSIRTTARFNSYASVSGTSFSAPLTNGVIAMIKIQNPTWTNSQVRDQLYSSAEDLGAAGEDNNYGHGRIDLDEAMNGGGGGGPGPLDLDITPFVGGQPATATTTNAVPGAEVFIYYTFSGFGTTTIPSLNVDLGIASAKPAGSSIADAAGIATFTKTVPASVSGKLVYVQSAALDTISQIRIAFIG